MGDFFLVNGRTYVFHMSVAAAHLDRDDYEVIGTLLGTEALGQQTLLIVKGEETGRITALQAFYLTGIDPVDDDEDSDEEIDADGVRILRVEGGE